MLFGFKKLRRKITFKTQHVKWQINSFQYVYAEVVSLTEEYCTEETNHVLWTADKSKQHSFRSSQALMTTVADRDGIGCVITQTRGRAFQTLAELLVFS